MEGELLLLRRGAQILHHKPIPAFVDFEPQVATKVYYGGVEGRALERRQGSRDKVGFGLEWGICGVGLDTAILSQIRHDRCVRNSAHIGVEYDVCRTVRTFGLGMDSLVG